MTPVTSATAAPTGSPNARRRGGAAWRDPRLWVGLVILTGSVLAGVVVLSVPEPNGARVWVASHDLEPGMPVTRSDLTPRTVDLGDTTGETYLSGQTPPEGMVLRRAVGKGELLPRSALASSEHSALVQVPVTTGAGGVPVTVSTGSLVDVWVVPEPAAGKRPSSAIQVFDDIRVVAAPTADGALAPAAHRRLVLGIPPGHDEQLSHALALMSGGTVYLTRQLG